MTSICVEAMSIICNLLNEDNNCNINSYKLKYSIVELPRDSNNSSFGAVHTAFNHTVSIKHMETAGYCH